MVVHAYNPSTVKAEAGGSGVGGQPGLYNETLSQRRVCRGWGQGGEMTQALYAHMNNKTIKKRERECMWGGVVVRVRKL
jgi:hypothetical protein